MQEVKQQQIESFQKINQDYERKPQALSELNRDLMNRIMTLEYAANFFPISDSIPFNPAKTGQTLTSSNK